MAQEHPKRFEPRMVVPKDLIGSAEVCILLGINRATVVRRIKSGKLPYLTQLDGSNGAFVFDRNDLPTEGIE